jgi:hypothetical protein
MNTSNERYDNLNSLIKKALEPEVSTAGEQLFRDSIEVIQVPDDEKGHLIEQIQVILDEQGDVVLKANTIKLPNLRFNLAKFLLSSIGTAVGVAGSIQKPIPLALTIIKFLQTTRDLATIEIKPKHAQVLLAIFSLSREENLVTIDKLDTVIKPQGITEIERPIILDHLERLGCITISMEEIQLNESIIIRSEI